MAIDLELVRDIPADVSAVLIPACSDHLGAAGPQDPGNPSAGIDAEDDLPPEADWRYLRARGFEGKVDQVAVMPGRHGTVLFLIGLGPSSSVDANVMRRAAAVAARAAFRHQGVACCLLDAAVDTTARPAMAQALAEGLQLGTYQYDLYKSNPEPSRIARVCVVSLGGKRVQGTLDVGSRIAEGVALARDLVNEPGSDLTPAVAAERIEALAAQAGLECTIWHRDQIEAERLGGLIGVNRGSTQPPVFVQLRYAPAGPARGRLGLVGKGVTFDSGGLSVKSSNQMMAMKGDMAGAAAVVGAMSVLGSVRPRCEVRAFLPFTDNMIGGGATRPGDVLRMRNDKTVEVLNTDAEGRLLLADALALATEALPDAIIDLATLTGAVETALGSKIAGLFSNNSSWAEMVSAAASRAGERLWGLPLPGDYRKNLDSDVADLRNVGKSASGGAITAALFLGEFVGPGIPWAHLDIAGTSWSTDIDGEVVKGGTGYGVRLLVELMRTFKKPAR